MECRQLMSTVDSRKNRIVKSATVFELVDFSRHTSEPEWSAPLLKTSKQSFKLLAMEEFQRERNWQKEEVRRKPPQDDSRDGWGWWGQDVNAHTYGTHTQEHTWQVIIRHHPELTEELKEGGGSYSKWISIKEKRARRREEEERRAMGRWRSGFGLYPVQKAWHIGFCHSGLKSPPTSKNSCTYYTVFYYLG